MEAMTARVVGTRVEQARERTRLECRDANCGSLRVSHPTLRLGPRAPTGPSDEREESIER